MNLIKISIIIPFYNVEKYIAECLDSVYAQDIPETEYEVICINDCSPDNSRQIVLDYQKKHPNLILVEHETNKMLGAARNTGLRSAKGKYVWFIDSDDFIEKNVFAKLLEIAEINKLEILHFNTQRVTNEKIISEFAFFPQNTGVISGINYLKNETLPYWEKLVAAWCQIFKREFLIRNELFFPEIYFMEDQIQTLRSLLVCVRFEYIVDKLHFYRYNPTSVMNANYYGGIKLADKIRFCVNCISLLDKMDSKETLLKDNLIGFYIYEIKSLEKKIIYLSNKNRYLFYRRLKDLDFSFLKKYMVIKERFIFEFQLITLILTNIFIPFLITIREIKRKLIK